MYSSKHGIGSLQACDTLSATLCAAVLQCNALLARDCCGKGLKVRVVGARHLSPAPSCLRLPNCMQQRGLLFFAWVPQCIPKALCKHCSAVLPITNMLSILHCCCQLLNRLVSSVAAPQVCPPSKASRSCACILWCPLTLPWCRQVGSYVRLCMLARQVMSCCTLV